MKTPVVLETDLIQEMADIGKRRLPNEACGVLIPIPWRGKRIFEIPNRSETPKDSFQMKSEDIVLVLEDWAAAYPNEASWDEVVIWHTHPGGGVGPSRVDMHNRIEYCGNLVVTLVGEGPPVAVWF